MYLIKLLSACPLSHKSPSLSTFSNTYLLMKPLKHRLTDLGFHPNEFCYLFLSVLFWKNRNRVLPNEFLLILTKIYMINLLYRVLHFSFSFKIIYYTFQAYNCFLLFICFVRSFFVINIIITIIVTIVAFFIAF